MGGRMTIGVLLSGLTAGALVGCSGGDASPAQIPEPTPTSSSACDVTDTRVTWEPMTEAPKADLGYRVLTVTGDGSQSNADHHVPYTSSVEHPGGLAFDDDALDFLLDDFSRTGQTTAQQIGEYTADFDVASLPDAEPGTHVLGYRIEQFAARFELDCHGDPAGSGALQSTTPNLHTSFVLCGAPLAENADDYARSLLEHCPR